MKTKRRSQIACTVLAACMGMLASVSGGCVEHTSNHFEGIKSFIVQVKAQNNDFGSVQSPLAFPTQFAYAGQCVTGEVCYAIEVGAYAVDVNGDYLPTFNGTAALNIVPGRVQNSKINFTNGLLGTWDFDSSGNPVRLQKGIVTGVRFSHGRARVWVEDTIDTEDRKASLATGLSREFVFEPQTIRMIQYNPDAPAGQTPLLGDFAMLHGYKGHDLVVTNVVSTGFYVTDLGDRNYNSIFIFTFSQPGRVEIGDRICELAGGIAEFTGMTQLQFPSWGIQNKTRSTAEDLDPAPEDGDQGVGSCIDKETGNTRPCTGEELLALAELVDCSGRYFDHPLSKEERLKFGKIPSPEPLILNYRHLQSANVVALKAMEASVVTVENVRLSSYFINCDDNGNGRIDSGTDEANCRTNCNNNPTCTELSSLESYDQWRAWTVDGFGEISVASSSIVANFDITKGCVPSTSPEGRPEIHCPERRLRRVTGNLRMVLPTCSGTAECDAAKVRFVMTIIEPRFSTDLIMNTEFNSQSEEEFKQKHGLP